MKFGEIIEEARVKAELNQKQLAARILKEDGEHISAPYLNDILSSRRTPTSDHMIEQFSKVLNIQPELLYYAAGKIPPWVYDPKADKECVLDAFEAFKQALQNKQRKLSFEQT